MMMYGRRSEPAPAALINAYKFPLTMFSLFKKNPSKKLEKEYNRLLEQARDAQRSGDIKLFATLSAQAEEVWKQVEAVKAAG